MKHSRNSWLSNADQIMPGQFHVQHPLGDAWPVDAGLVIDMTADLLPEGSIAVSSNDVADCSRSVASAASPVDSTDRTSA